MRLSDDICRCSPINECKQRTECDRAITDEKHMPWHTVADFSSWIEAGSDCVMWIKVGK